MYASAQIIKGLHFIIESAYKNRMSDIISNNAAQSQWRQFEAAVLELDPEKLQDKLLRPVSLFDRIEGGFPNLSEGEQLALHDALDMLLALHDAAQPEIVEEQKTGT